MNKLSRDLRHGTRLEWKSLGRLRFRRRPGFALAYDAPRRDNRRNGVLVWVKGSCRRRLVHDQ
jgi:hypothetical protein